MPTGVNDARITTNDLVTRYMPEMVRKLQAPDLLSTFVHPDPMPDGFNGTMNYVIDTTSDTAERIPPGGKRRSKQRKGYEVNIIVGDKLQDSRQITWEKIKQGRFREVPLAMDAVADTLLRGRMNITGDTLFTNAITNSGTPTDPSAAASGETPHWWNTNDTEAPPAYGQNTFTAGHDHVETGGAVAVTLDKIRDAILHVTEHGYGSSDPDGKKNGLAVLMNGQEENTILKLANVAQQNQTLSIGLREDLQRSGRAAGFNGLLGAQYVVNDWVPRGVMGYFDSNLANLPQGGVVKVIEFDTQTASEDELSTKSTWVEAWEKFQTGVLHKGAGYVAHVA